MTNIPKSIGIILDGNRRWAKSQNLPSLHGHRAGFEKTKDIVKWCRERGVKEVIFYAFSTENWKRAPEEVSYLMDLFEQGIGAWATQALEDGARLRFIGERERFSSKLQALMQDVEEKTALGAKGTIVIALSYGGRAEILAGVNALLALGAKSVSEEGFSAALWSAGLLDPDMIIRTGGEHRLSNFLTWQSVYSELFFTDTMLPDLSEEEFDSMLEEYASRERRRGK